MILNVWILLAIVALLIVSYSLVAANDEVALIASTIASVSWLVVAYGALNLETFNESSGAYVTQSEPALAVLALIGVLLGLVNACVIIFDWFSETTNDVNGA